MLEVEKLIKLKHSISNAADINELRSLRDQFQLSIQGQQQLLTLYSTAQWNLLINEMHDLFLKKVITMAELRMVGEGLGPPPTSYSYILLGSAGRYEQTIASDQDSAFIYENSSREEEVRHYFLQFTSYIVKMLVELGYPRCDGRVLSDELDWCLSVDQWKARLDYWFTEQSWESIRYILIMADGRCVEGNKLLFDTIMSYYYERLASNKNIYDRMIDNTNQYKVVLGVFGQFITERYGNEKGYINIKYGSYIPLISSIRWLALWNNIVETSTLVRLQQLRKKDVFSEEQYEKYKNAVLRMISLRLFAGYELIDGQYEGKSKLNPNRLNKSDVKEIKNNFRISKEIQKKILRKFSRRK